MWCKIRCDGEFWKLFGFWWELNKGLISRCVCRRYAWAMLSMSFSLSLWVVSSLKIRHSAGEAVLIGVGGQARCVYHPPTCSWIWTWARTPASACLPQCGVFPFCRWLVQQPGPWTWTRATVACSCRRQSQIMNLASTRVQVHDLLCLAFV
jgi:hypothetical protein